MGRAYGGENMTDLTAFWFIDWLSRQAGYTPQPYEQCAKVLREAGQPGKANQGLLAGKGGSAGRPSKTGKSGAGLGWACMEWLVGHGIGQYSFLSLTWVVLFGAAGAALAFWQPPAGVPAWGWWRSIAYSLDTLLPFLKLGKANEGLVFTQWVAVLFYFQKLLGWFLGFFVVTGLTGLTRKP